MRGEKLRGREVRGKGNGKEEKEGVSSGGRERKVKRKEGKEGEGIKGGSGREQRRGKKQGEGAMYYLEGQDQEHLSLSPAQAKTQ
jgi:hypothetical protein